MNVSPIAVNTVLGTATRRPTPYQTLVSVNNIDQEKFVQTDLATVSKHWSKVFFNNTVSEDIYNAISAKNGTAKSTTDQVSKSNTVLMTAYNYCYH